MNYLESERRRLVSARDALFRDPGQGVFASKARDFVLSEPGLNLWAGVRDDVVAYFKAYCIAWWRGAGDDPTGHMLSSQVACLNHLYFLRQRGDIASAVLRSLDPQIVGAEPIEDDGYVAFEFIGSRQVLAERGFTRGARCTSVDAAMVGRTAAGERRLFLIEWKYTEAYPAECKYIPARAAVYDHHILEDNSPFAVSEVRDLYFEPFYQLMRQTLLGWLLVQANELDCSSFRHVHVAPDANRQFHQNVTAPGLRGSTVYEAWRGVLRQPLHFLTRSPEQLMAPAAGLPDTKSALNYLEARYWAAVENGLVSEVPA